MSHLAKPPPLNPLLVISLTIFRLPEPPLGMNSSVRLVSKFLKVDQFSSTLELLRSVCQSFSARMSFMEV